MDEVNFLEHVARAVRERKDSKEDAQ